VSDDAENLSRYDEVILAVFERLVQQHGEDARTLPFDKNFLDQIANELRIKNVPDIIYSYRSGRRAFPRALLEWGNWVIIGEGKGKYALVKLDISTELAVPSDLETTPIPDATPEIVLHFAKGDEQSMLVQIRYNRLIDIFTGLTAYHLQSHLRAYVREMGQVEVDDLYLGVNTDGQWFCIPVEAKPAGPKDQLNRTQVSSMVAYAEQEFSDLPARPVGVKMANDGSMFFVEFTATSDPLKVQSRFYKRYFLIRETP
jgi:hypothetical protein